MATPVSMAPKNSGAQASTNPCGWKFSKPDRWPSWKIHFATPNAAAIEARLVTTPTKATSGLPSAISSSRKPSADEQPEDQRGAGGQRLLQVVVLGRRAADERAGG